jgi:hypothetical protein
MRTKKAEKAACQCCGEVRPLAAGYCVECDEAGCRYELACLVEVQKLDEGARP